MKRFVIGDIHGAHKALIQCLERSGFNYENDLLISLGDICDGWPETKACIDELLKIKNLIITLGNHDQWALEWMKTGKKPTGWISQGGRQTIESYGSSVPEDHIALFDKAKLYHLSGENELFVHAGIVPNVPMESQDPQVLLWDRDFFYAVTNYIDNKDAKHFTGFKEVFLGHSPVHRLGFYTPLQVGEVWLMDTGAAWEGTLSIMDVDSKETFISDKPMELYPTGSGRF